MRFHDYYLEEVLVDGHTVLLGHQHLSVLTLLLQHHEVKGKEDDETPLPWHFLYHLGAPASIRTHITKFRMSRSAASLVLSAAQTLDGLGDHGGGGAALVLPGWGQNAGQLVVPGLDEISNVLPFLHYAVHFFLLNCKLCGDRNNHIGYSVSGRLVILQRF